MRTSSLMKMRRTEEDDDDEEILDGVTESGARPLLLSMVWKMSPMVKKHSHIYKMQA